MGLGGQRQDFLFCSVWWGGGGMPLPSSISLPRLGHNPPPPQVRTQGWGGYGRGGGHKGGGPGAGGRLGGTVGLGVPWVLWGWMM